MNEKLFGSRGTERPFDDIARVSGCFSFSFMCFSFWVWNEDKHLHVKEYHLLFSNIILYLKGSYEGIK